MLLQPHALASCDWSNNRSLVCFLKCICRESASAKNTVNLLADIFYVFRFLADMVVSFHKSYSDDFGSTVDIVALVHVAYAKDPQNLLLDAVMNAPLELLVFAIAHTPGQMAVLMFYYRLNRVLRMIKTLLLFYGWETDIRRKYSNSVEAVFRLNEHILPGLHATVLRMIAPELAHTDILKRQIDFTAMIFSPSEFNKKNKNFHHSVHDCFSFNESVAWNYCLQ